MGQKQRKEKVMNNRYNELNSYLQKQFDGLINSMASHQRGDIDVVWNLEHVHNLEDECTWLVEGYSRCESGVADYWWCDSREEAEEIVSGNSDIQGSLDSSFAGKLDAYRITRIAVLDHEWIEEFPSLEEILEDEVIQDELKLLRSHFMGADDGQVNCDDWECRLANRMHVLMGSPFDDESGGTKTEPNEYYKQVFQIIIDQWEEQEFYNVDEIMTALRSYVDGVVAFDLTKGFLEDQ